MGPPPGLIWHEGGRLQSANGHEPDRTAVRYGDPRDLGGPLFARNCSRLYPDHEIPERFLKPRKDQAGFPQGERRLTSRLTTTKRLLGEPSPPGHEFGRCAFECARSTRPRFLLRN